MALIGAVALIVIGPEKLPRVARTVGTMLGKAQRYVADVKAEVNRSMELDELKKMKETVENAAREVEQTGSRPEPPILRSNGPRRRRVRKSRLPFPGNRQNRPTDIPARSGASRWARPPSGTSARQGIRTRALSGAARVARYRPQRPR